MVLAPAWLLREEIKNKYNISYVDKLHNIVTSKLLLGFAFIFLLRFTFKDPIICWQNAYELPKWNAFIAHYCYVDTLYFVPPGQISFPNATLRYDFSVKYYPWIPVSLVIQAFLYFIPYYFFQKFSCSTGISVQSFSASLALNETQARKVMGNRKFEKYHEDSHVVFLKNLKFNSNRRKYMISASNYLTSSYIFYKLLNLLNAIFQLFLLNYSLNTGYYFSGGLMALKDITSGKKWENSGLFPRIIYCDFPRRDDWSSNPFLSTTQCLLPFNMYYEIIYILMSFWFLILIAANIFSIFCFIKHQVYYEDSISFVEDKLVYFGVDRRHPQFYYFLYNVLKTDGVTVLRLLESNVTPYHLCLFVNDLFLNYPFHFSHNE